MATAMGFANAFGRAGFFDTDRLTDVASNSGGTWFLGQFAFNADFRDATLGDVDGLHQFVVEVIKAYSSVLAVGGEVRLPTDVNLLRTLASKASTSMDLKAKLSLLVNVAQAAVFTGFDWLDLTGQMLRTTPGLKDKSFYERTMVSQEARSFLKRQTLHFQAAKLTSSYQWRRAQLCVLGKCVDGPETIYRTYLLNSNSSALLVKGGDKELPVVPMQYILPGSADSVSAAGWQAPESSKYNFNAMHIARASWNLFNSYDPSSESLTDEQPAPPLPHELSLQKLHAASSAAAGALGSPTLLREIITNNVGEFVFNALKATLPDGLENLAICSRPLQSGGFALSFPGSRRCEYPAHSLIDGGYSDNLAVAQTVGLMQRRFGRQSRLRMVLTESEAKGSVKALMAGHLYAPGAIFRSSSPAPGIDMLSPQVFATPFASLDFRPVDGPSPTRFYNLSVAQLSTITVDNPAFGVAAGTLVDLLIFHLGSVLTSFQVGFSQEHGDVAASIARSEAGELLMQWME